MERYINIKQILDDLLEHPLLQDLSFERAVNHCVDFIRIVGCPRIFNEKTVKLEVKDYRAMLPCDYHKMIQVRTCTCGRTATFRYSTDSFHMSEDKHCNLSDLTYKIQGQVIFTSIKEGEIEIAYEAISVDEEGYPLIPDNSSFTRALELYIKKKCFTIQFDLGKISPQVYNNVCQEYAWAVGAAQNELIKPSIDEMESITNAWNNLIPRVNEHKTGFVTLGTKEQWKTH